MEEARDTMPNYKIWHFGKTRWDKVVDERFYAVDDDAAYKHLVEFSNKTPVMDGRCFYYSTIHYTCTVDGSGKHSEMFDLDDLASRAVARKRSKSWLRRALEETMFFFGYYFVDRPKDFYYWARDLVYLLKNKEAYSNQWNLDWHLLDSIERNVPSLIENSHALAFIDEAIVKVHGNEPGFDIGQYHKDHCMGYPKEIEDLAVQIQKEEYSKLLLYVKLYRYYADFGNIDFNNSEEVTFDKQWRHTLPIKQGTYDEIADYKKAMALSKEYWDKIWDWMKAYGQKLND